MENNTNDIDSQQVNRAQLRPALIASREMLYEYSYVINHILAGLIDESVPTLLVSTPDSSAEHIVPPSVEVIKYPFYNLPFLGSQNRKILLEQLSGFKPTLLHCLCPSHAILTKKLAKELSIPYILSVNALQRDFTADFLSKKRLAKIIVPSEIIKNTLYVKYPEMSGRITMVHPGSFAEDSPVCFKNPSRVPSLVTASPLRRLEDFLPLLNAARRLAIDGYDFILVIAGNGPAESKLMRTISSFGLSPQTTLVPQPKNWRQVISGADIFIQPRPVFRFNPLLLEAMSAGVAMTACKGGIDDLLIDQKTCLLFEQDDELSIYSCLQKILDDRNVAKNIAAGAQDHIRRNYSVAQMIEDLLTVYRQSQRWFNK